MNHDPTVTLLFTRYAAIAHIETESNAPDAPMLLVAQDDWHPGVIGIVAGRLREKYRKPVVVVANKA